MKKTYITTMPNHIGAFLQASRCFAKLGVNITRVSYNKAIDIYTLFIDAEGTPEQLAKADEELTAIGYLQKELTGKKCYVFGTRSFYEQLETAGIRVTTRLEDDVDVLLCGFDTELTFQKLEDACILLQRGVDFVATNPDWVCPTWYGGVPDCGSVCEMLHRATGRRPKVIGKPQPEMIYLALQRTGFAPEQAVMVGDRLYTDIASGVNAGIDTIFVLSGEGVMEDIEEYHIQPTWVMDHIRDLYRSLEV